MKRRILSMIMALVMIATCLVSPALASSTETQPGDYDPASQTEVVRNSVTGELIQQEVTEKDTTEVEILVAVDDGSTVFLETSNLELAVASSDDQRANLYAAESCVEAALGLNVEVDHYFSLIFNGFSFKGETWMADAINEIEGLSAMVTPMLELIAPAEEEAVVHH